jgi:alkaline phosphatase D
MHRRAFLSAAAALPLSGLRGIIATRRSPAMMARVLADSSAPAIPGGVQSGDVTATRAMLWSRTDRAAQMMVELSDDESFRTVRLVEGPAALEDTAFAAKLDVGDLTAGEPVFYRAWFEDLERPGLRSEAVAGRFRAAPRAARDLTVCWSGDVVGQGWGINPDFGGLRLYETMARHAPDVFVHSGDMIYADNPLMAEVPMPDGSVWRNLVTPAKSRVAETLDEFRGNFAYNLLDRHARAFNAATPMIVQWDDHEVMNNWHPGTVPSDRPGYSTSSIALLAARSRRAMFEGLPIRTGPEATERVYRAFAYGPLLEILVLDQRSYRGPNSRNRQAASGTDTRMMGPSQLQWLQQRLKASPATWKLVASDMPLGLLIGDGERDGQPLFEGWANGDGPPLGRELEIAELLSFIRRERIENVVWVTADVHYAAAHYYDPARAVFRDFTPFWEFVAGPLHAGTFGPGTPDPTFGCTPVFASSPPGMAPNRPPSEGRQHFGLLRIDARTRRLRVTLHDLSDRVLWETVLEPR